MEMMVSLGRWFESGSKEFFIRFFLFHPSVGTYMHNFRRLILSKYFKDTVSLYYEEAPRVGIPVPSVPLLLE